jgi:hypothetical protein
MINWLVATQDPAMVEPEPVTLRTGAAVRVRAIRPDNAPRLMALCRRLCWSPSMTTEETRTHG